MAWFNWQAPGEKPFAPNTGFYPPTGSDLLNITDVVGAFLSRLSSGKPAYMMSGQNLQNYKASGAKSMDEYKKLVSEGKAIPPGGDVVLKTSAPAPAPAGLDLARPKPFAMTSEGQFERYFKTPEMDQYFGAASRGKGAPADAAAMEKLAFEQQAPLDAPLATFYRAQSASGRANMPEIVAGITAGKDAETAKNLKAWAEANPAAAQRLYAKSNVGYGLPRMAPESEAMLKAVGGEQGEFITRQPGPNMPVGDADIEQYEGERIIEATKENQARKSGASVRDRADDFVGNLYQSYLK